MTVDFKLFSVSSLLSSLRLLFFTFPFTILPEILYYGGPAQREYERATGKNYTNYQVVGLFELCLTEYCLSFLIYILPLAFSYSAIENTKKTVRCFTEFQNMFVMDERPRLIILEQVLFPLVGFLLFAVGKLLNLVYMVKIIDHPGFYLIRYIYTCNLFLTHLPLHFLLAIHENYLYQFFNLFHEMCSWTLRATVHEGTLPRAKILPEAMGAFQGAFGFFLLVDITLMLIYWLLHTYHAYFAFQVILKGMNNFLVIKFHSSCFQESVLPATGTALIILAEFSRIFLLTNQSSKYR